MVCAASVADRQGGRRSLLGLHLDQLGLARRAAPLRRRRLRRPALDWAHPLLQIAVEVVRKPAGQRGFAVIGRRWVVERTYAWLTAHRRLARDDERHPTHSEAMIYWVMIGTCPPYRPRQARHPPRPLTKSS